FIPTHDSMRNAGFFLPGAAVGLIITGTPPIEAMIFQCIMFLAWCASTIISSSIINTLVVHQFVTRNHQINYEIVRALVLPDREHARFEHYHGEKFL
ncbi:MAG TPA: ABC transporter permease, partial [Candidatus Lokiarchaeia archaeon]|nr:ABC transporter permease [Candidatus Lokiarchaeia archaeon]